jgi:glycosyltransferase involved in cell wall biosynthesis
MKLSIIIPCYNEYSTIKEIIEKINNQKKFDKEIIVVDDCSSDGTLEILNSLKDQINSLILNKKNYGKGYCIKKELKLHLEI